MQFLLYFLYCTLHVGFMPYLELLYSLCPIVVFSQSTFTILPLLPFDLIYSHYFLYGGYPRESNCRQFGARNSREKFLTRFHVRVKYVDSHYRQVSDIKLSAALESYLAVVCPFESKNYIHITLRQLLTHFIHHDGIKEKARCRYSRVYNYATEKPSSKEKT